MILSQEDIEEFLRLWFGEDLAAEQVLLVAERFLSGMHQIVMLSERADRFAAEREKPGRESGTDS